MLVLHPETIAGEAAGAPPDAAGAHQMRSRSTALPDQITVVTGGRDLLRDLEAFAGIDPDALEIADHDADDVVFRKRAVRGAVEVFVERELRRRHHDVLLRPHLAEGGMFVDWFSIRMRSRGTLIPMAISAN